MMELVQGHLKTLAEYPPVQGGTSFDMSNIIEEFLKSRQ
jgi:arylsulfatase